MNTDAKELTGDITPLPIWMKASVKMPDSPDYWLASDKTQEGKIVYAKVSGEKAIGYFFRSKNKLWFSYVYYEKIIEGLLAPYWSDNSDRQLTMDEFDKIEWLNEEACNEYPSLKLLNNELVEALEDLYERFTISTMSSDYEGDLKASEKAKALILKAKI